MVNYLTKTKTMCNIVKDHQQSTLEKYLYDHIQCISQQKHINSQPKMYKSQKRKKNYNRQCSFIYDATLCLRKEVS